MAIARKGEGYVAFDPVSDSDFCGRSGVAVQPRLGLLPQRRAGYHSLDRDHSDAARNDSLIAKRPGEFWAITPVA
jgi:hypothetical protein